MWNSLNAVARKVKNTAKVIAAEAYETANELRSIHQVRRELRVWIEDDESPSPHSAERRVRTRSLSISLPI